MDQWTFKNKTTGWEPTMELSLYWEVDGDPISDDYLQEEISASELWSLWRRKNVPGNGWVHVNWSVFGSGGVSAVAPFVPWGLAGSMYESPTVHESSFLAQFTWPVNSETGERLNFLRLPVVDKLWRPGQTEKGGFIQEYLGWKPSPLQSRIHVPTLEAARGSA